MRLEHSLRTTAFLCFFLIGCLASDANERAQPGGKADEVSEQTEKTWILINPQNISPHSNETARTFFELNSGAESNSLLIVETTMSATTAEIDQHFAADFLIPDHSEQTEAGPYDEFLSPLADLPSHGQGSNYVDGPVIVALLDEYIDNREEQESQGVVFWENAGEIPDNGIDDDGNGSIDDTHGYHFGDDVAAVFPTIDPNNESTSHGTAVLDAFRTHFPATTVGNLRVMSLPVFRNATSHDSHPAGYYSFRVAAWIKALLYAVDNGAHIVNASNQATAMVEFIHPDLHQAFDKLFRLVIDHTLDKGTMVFNSAGNNIHPDVLADPSGEFIHWDLDAPGNCPYPQCVTSHSNFYVISTHIWNGGAETVFTSLTAEDDAVTTSFASPMVASLAAAALLEGYDRAEITSKLLEHTDLNDVWVEDNQSGGVLNIADFLDSL